MTCGLIDIQVNGFAGVDFNNSSLCLEAIEHACAALACSGVVKFCPTIITAAPERMSHLLNLLQRACRQSSRAATMIAGIHLEGPFLAKGAHGAHTARHLCRPNLKLFQKFQRAAANRIRIVTLAPELPGAIRLVRQLATEGMIVAIGHTHANEHIIVDATAAGARLSTHLGNGIEAMIDRHQNPLWAQLAEDDLVGSIIPDGIHLPASVLQVFLKAKRWQRLILTTDCMSAAGAPPDRTYTLGDTHLTVGADRIVRLPGHQNFAGSALTLDKGICHFSKTTGLDFSRSVHLASVNPAKLLGLPRSSISGRCLWHRTGSRWKLVGVR